MSNSVINFIKEVTKAKHVEEGGKIADLWSGYGSIKRYSLTGTNIKSVVVKNIDIAKAGNHPRGWNSKLSHQRKLKSYKVEIAWYKNYRKLLDDRCYVPKCYGSKISNQDSHFIVLLEDLDQAGYPQIKTSVNLNEIKTCLKWLARFHATFAGVQPKELWETGTYWHLATRPDELNALKDKDLKYAARAIDQTLNDCQFKTVVHGDAKLANFCFSKDSKTVAAVDFQYVGGGAGVKDVAYFLGSCLEEKECEKYEEELLSYYFDILQNIIKSKKPNINSKDLIDQWRYLYPVAWADFHRFIKGWSPGHWKINSYSEKITKAVISKLL